MCKSVNFPPKCNTQRSTFTLHVDTLLLICYLNQIFHPTMPISDIMYFNNITPGWLLKQPLPCLEGQVQNKWGGVTHVKLSYSFLPQAAITRGQCRIITPFVNHLTLIYEENIFVLLHFLTNHRFLWTQVEHLFNLCSVMSIVM